jgi:hypothetical protein
MKVNRNMDLINILARCRARMSQETNIDVKLIAEIDEKIATISGGCDVLREEERRELNEWRKLKNKDFLHLNLLRGIPAELSREKLIHLLGEGGVREVSEGVFNEKVDFYVRASANIFCGFETCDKSDANAIKAFLYR